MVKMDIFSECSRRCLGVFPSQSTQISLAQIRKNKRIADAVVRAVDVIALFPQGETACKPMKNSKTLPITGSSATGFADRQHHLQLYRKFNIMVALPLELQIHSVICNYIESLTSSKPLRYATGVLGPLLLV
ncbi:hypothetical protein AVEN_266288-1 [Araneus ventricosus]|uniref:Uncharacterized protein n=1 Tax=Araneus ventricosus TaxID=182803 RepID=A0A4Y2ECN5_ARAVE|nr:hypothetical protein AVEN_266288-1 [Araneus ventricosus]